MSRDKLVDVNPLMHASVNVGCKGKSHLSGTGKIHEVILVYSRILKSMIL